MSIFQFISLLLALFATVVTSQRSQECLDAANALAANERCLNSFLAVTDSISDRTDISIQELNTFCSLDCRDLSSRAVFECQSDANDIPLRELEVDAFKEILCASNGEESCYDFAVRPPPEFLAARDALNSSRVCSRQEDDAQTCSPDCIIALQNLVNVGGCCVVELFELASQLLAMDEIASICILQSNLPEVLETPCQILGSGVNGGPTTPGSRVNGGPTTPGSGVNGGPTAHGNIHLLLLAVIINIMAFF